MPFPGRFSMFQSTTSWSSSKTDTVSYPCKSYLYFHYPTKQDRNLEKATIGPHVLPPDGSHSWWSRRRFPPLSLALNLYWKLWLQLASVTAAISLLIFGEPRKNDSEKLFCLSISIILCVTRDQSGSKALGDWMLLVRKCLQALMEINVKSTFN